MKSGRSIPFRYRTRKERGKFYKRIVLLFILAVLLVGVGSYSYFNSSKLSIGQSSSALDLSELPEYSGNPYYEINENKPGFTQDEISEALKIVSNTNRNTKNNINTKATKNTKSTNIAKGTNNTSTLESYSKLDALGRCGFAVAICGKETMPTEERGEIGSIRPTGWKQARYDDLVASTPGYLYNRCHLIAYCLTGENANERNLITGTNYMNTEGMLPFEEKTARYIDETKNHVLYRVTPIFEGSNLLASGVEMEAYSLEDGGAGICFHVYVYNVQPGVKIDYRTGKSKRE